MLEDKSTGAKARTDIKGAIDLEFTNVTVIFFFLGVIQFNSLVNMTGQALWLTQSNLI